MTGAFRIKPSDLIDPSRKIRFSFDGAEYEGLQGDTLASALLANGVHLMGRSFKYHRPRGVMSAGPEESNALVVVSRGTGRFTPNNRATMVELYDGMLAKSQNRWPSLDFDLGSVVNLGAKLIPAGFYYKTFMWPRWAWKAVYEPAIRASAGLGAPPVEPDPDRYTNQYAHCDILIVGGGPAGLSAALAAQASGARVMICDERDYFGGSLLAADDETVDDAPAKQWLQDVSERLLRAANVTVLPRTTAFGYYSNNMICLAERLTDHHPSLENDAPRERMWQVRARHVILATGAIERPSLFSNNDRPGVMLSGAARYYLNRYGVAVGKRVAIVTNNNTAYRTALDLLKAGVQIAAIVDARSKPEGALVDAAKSLGINIIAGSAAVAAIGSKRVSGLKIAYVDDRPGSTISCDAILTSSGWTPTVHLFSQSGGKLKWDDAIGAYVPHQATQNVSCAGACNGVTGLGSALNEGIEAANRALQSQGFQAHQTRAPATEDNELAGSADAWLEIPTHAEDDVFVDLQNDVKLKDIKLAVREGFLSIEHVKRYTTNGMATDQGKTSNIHGLLIAASELKKTPPEVGLTTFRPPYTPVTFGAVANVSRDLGFDPVRKTPTHDWAARCGAIFEDVGMWKRARYFPKSGESMAEAVNRECLAVRQAAGIVDASTLGKIEVVGPDAAQFMNLLYTNAWTKLQAGRCRYGLMLREDGYIFDDGVVGRLADDRFHITTTSGGAARVFMHMEDYRQTEFPDLRVWLTSTTEQWGVIAVNGPRAREIIEPLVEGIDLGKEAFQHMSVREGRVLGVPARIFRISFTGELGFEINVPSNSMMKVWEAVLKSGEAYGVVPYGTEAMHVLRAEKGYIIVGQDTDGAVTPHDVGMSWAVAASKKDFVGKRSLKREALIAPGRKHLVGLLTENVNEILAEGAQVLEPDGASKRSIGHVTSSYWSATLNRSIAMALVVNGRERLNDRLAVTNDNGLTSVRVTGTDFYDPAGDRLNV